MKNLYGTSFPAPENQRRDLSLPAAAATEIWVSGEKGHPLGVRGNQFLLRRQIIGMPDVIVIQKGQQVSSRPFTKNIASLGNTLVALLKYCDTRQVAIKQLNRVISAAIIHRKNLIGSSGRSEEH